MAPMQYKETALYFFNIFRVIAMLENMLHLW